MLVPILILLGALGLITLVYAFAIEPNWLRIRCRTVYVRGWSTANGSVRILHLSDLHVGRSNRRLRRFIGRVSKIPADVVVITGDFLESHEHLPGLLGVLGPLLTDPKPVIGVLGNHDRYDYPGWWTGESAIPSDAVPLIHTLRNAGVQLLIDSACAVETDSGRFTFAGVDIRSHTDEGVTSAVVGLDLSNCVVLAHSPDIHRIAALSGAKLVLAGHTHGGQIRLGPWFAPTTATTRRLKPPSGIHTEGDTVMHVNPGLGTTFMPLRFFARPEATVIEVHAAER